MNKKLLVALIFSVLLFIAFSGCYELITTYQAHATFDGYCTWRGLEIVNRSNDFGYCDNSAGQIYKMVLVNGRWYLDGDLPNGWSF